jgi:hypothetical protein
MFEGEVKQDEDADFFGMFSFVELYSHDFCNRVPSKQLLGANGGMVANSLQLLPDTWALRCINRSMDCRRRKTARTLLRQHQKVGRKTQRIRKENQDNKTAQLKGG